MAVKGEPKLLIAYHSKDHAQDIAIFLAGQGYQAQVVAGAREAMDISRTYDFDGAILSSLLPDGNGMELCRNIKKDPANEGIKCIIISSITGSSRMAIDAKNKYLADGYIEEPLSMTELVTLVDQVLEHKPEPEKPKESSKKSQSTKVEHTDFSKVAFTELDAPEEPDPGKRIRAGKKQSNSFSRTRFEDSTVPLEGSLSEYLFPEIFLYTYQSRATGTLHTKSLNEERSIYFKDGIPIFIRTNFILDESIGQILVRHKLLTQNKLNECLKESQNEGVSIGETLVGKKIIHPNQMEKLLVRQARLKVVNAFRRAEGTYFFIPDESIEGINIRVQSDILRLLLAGVRHHLRLSVLEKRIFDNKDRPVIQNMKERIRPGDLGLNRKQWNILFLAREKKRLGDIIAKSEMNFVQTFQVLYMFFLFGLLRFTDNGPTFFRLQEQVLSRAINEMRTGHGAILEEDSTQDIPTNGKITSFPLTIVLFNLHMKKETGTLTVDMGETKEKITLRFGKPVKCETIGESKLSLGNVLVEQGLVARDVIDNALEDSQVTDLTLGGILLQQGLISPHVLFEALTYQMREKLKSILTLAEGTYSYEAVDPNTLKSETVFDIDIAKVIVGSMMQTIQTSSAENELTKYREFLLERTPTGRDRLESLFTDPKDLQLVALIQGRMNSVQITDRVSMPAKRAYQIIFTLRRLNLIQFVEQ